MAYKIFYVEYHIFYIYITYIYLLDVGGLRVACEALRELTVAVMELMKLEKTPMARRITHTAKNLAQEGKD